MNSAVPDAPPPRDEALQTARERARDAEVLVARAREGDAAAFGELVVRFRPRIYALALHLTGDPSDADDVTQEVFLAAYDRLGAFEGRSALFTWLYRIALRRALNLGRSVRRRRTVDLDDPRIGPALAVDRPGAGELAEVRERYGLLLAAFDALSPSLRSTVVLVTLQGLSHAEAAVVLQTTEGTVAWRIHEARRRLRLDVERLESVPRSARATGPAWGALDPLLAI